MAATTSSTNTPSFGAAALRIRCLAIRVRAFFTFGFAKNFADGLHVSILTNGDEAFLKRVGNKQRK